MKSTVAEEFSPKLLVSKAEEISLLVDFIKGKVRFKGFLVKEILFYIAFLY